MFGPETRYMTALVAALTAAFVVVMVALVRSLDIFPLFR